jgi:amidase
MTIESGETIVVETINHMTPVVRSEDDLHAHGSPQYREREETGPICVRGARPGDMLAIRIENIQLVGLPHAHGSGPLSDRFPQKPLAFPITNGNCRFPGGRPTPLAPMIGDIYTTPATLPPTFDDHGGNMDFTEVRPGNTLYLPVFRAGGLLVLGDVHAAQGDGELYGEGAECAADVTITVTIDRTYRHPRPLVETPDRLMTLACRGPLGESVARAVADMTDLLARLHGIRPEDAYIFTCTVGSLRLAGCLARRETAEKRCLVALSVPKRVA